MSARLPSLAAPSLPTPMPGARGQGPLALLALLGLALLAACGSPEPTGSMQEVADASLPDGGGGGDGPSLADAAADAGADSGPGSGGSQEVGWDAGDGGEAEDAALPEEDVHYLGQLNLVYWTPDYLFDYPELHLQAVFSPTLARARPVDAVGWLAWTQDWNAGLADDYWALPAQGQSGAMDPVTLHGDLQIGDGGLYVAVGERLVARYKEELEDVTGARVYTQLFEESANSARLEALDRPLRLRIDGGEDVAPADIPQALTLPPPVVLTSHDAGHVYPLRYGRSPVLSWERTGHGRDSILLTVDTERGGRVWNLADTGNADFGALLAEAGLGDAEEMSFSLARLRPQQIPLNGGALRVHALNRQWLYGQRVGAWEMWPREWPKGATTTVELTWWDGRFDPSRVWVDAGAEVRVTNLQVLDRQGQHLRFDVTVPENAQSGPRLVRAGTLANRADIRLEQGAYVVEPMFSSGTCESAVDDGPVPDGTYYATNAGLPFGSFQAPNCPMGNPRGREQVIPVSLLAGQTLHARVEGPESWPVLYLARSCQGTGSVQACTAADYLGLAAQLRYTALEDEEVLLVVDGRVAPHDGAESYRVEISRTAPRPLAISPVEVTAGRVHVLEVRSTVGPFDAQPVFTASAGVVVTGVEVDAQHPTLARVTVEVPARVAPQAGFSVDLGVSIGAVRHLMTGALAVRPEAVGAVVCEAQGLAIGGGSYEGSTAQGSREAVRAQSCLGYEAEGPAAIYQVELGPSQTLRARVKMPGRDVVLSVVEDCQGAVLTCADRTGRDRVESVQWTGPPRPSVVYLVVDGLQEGDAGPFLLDISVGF